MNIILISECRKKAARDSRRILSKYARHIARRTWVATITKEGLGYLQQELTAIANKNSAIACHKIISRHEIALAWIVGSHKPFDEEGNFAFRYTENIAERYQIDLSEQSHELMLFLSYLNKLAGLFHDVGKNFYYFQNKLIQQKKGKDAGDPIRHEYLSLLCFFYLFEDDEPQRHYSEQLLALEKKVDTLNFKSLQTYIATKTDSFNACFQQEKETSMVLKLLAHLILSHHRLVSGKENNKKIMLMDEDYFNTVYAELDKKETIFDLYQDQSFVLYDTQWKRNFNTVIGHLKEQLNKPDSALPQLLEKTNLVLCLGHYILRPALIMADQRVSARESKVKQSKRTQASYAQQTALANTSQQGQANQNLKEHLSGVGQQSFKTTKALWQSISSRKRLYTTPATDKIKQAVAQSLKAFQWQNVAVNVIKQQNFPDSFGFFAVVMAQTGAGKTRANAKIMAALNPDLRFSTLLGLRTLTLQTLDEYQAHLGIKKTAILGVIGDRNTQLLHEADKEDKNKGNKTEDKETSTLSALFSEEEGLEMTKNLFKDVDTPFPDELCFSNQHDSKLDAMTKIPILVATIDYMVRGIEANRSSKTRFLLRLMTSDLIIDEIDSYNQNDLMAIHKLVYLVGFYGKKLIISSATLPELLIQSFYLAYSTGYQRFCQYADKQHAPLYMGLFTHIDTLNQVSLIKNNKAMQHTAAAIITPFIDRFYIAIQQQKVKRRASVLDISDYLHSDVNKHDDQHRILAPLYRSIFTAAEGLHQANHSSIKGIQISTGLIKFNNTVDAFNCARYLLTDPALEANAMIRVECYHARHFPIRRNYVEEQLSQLLNRKKESSFKKNKIVQKALKEAKEQQKTRVILLIVSTTIIEIGRDFDFDWGIIEPSSHWSIVQTSGRIMRHRQQKRCDNVVLLSHSMKAVRATKKSNRQLYSRPGPETSTYSLSTEDKYKPLDELFEYQQLKQKIDASVTLKNTTGKPIKNLENKQIEAFIDSKALASLHSYLNHPLEYLSTFNTDKNPFRGKYQAQTIYQQDEHNRWFYIDKRKELIENTEAFDIVCLNERSQSRHLLNKSLEDIEAEYAEKGIELTREITSPIDSENTKKYNEFLGLL